MGADRELFARAVDTEQQIRPFLACLGTLQLGLGRRRDEAAGVVCVRGVRRGLRRVVRAKSGDRGEGETGEDERCEHGGRRARGRKVACV